VRSMVIDRVTLSLVSGIGWPIKRGGADVCLIARDSAEARGPLYRVRVLRSRFRLARVEGGDVATRGSTTTVARKGE
jgi:hypothetical protein